MSASKAVVASAAGPGSSGGRPETGQRQPRVGQSGDDILSKIMLKSGVGTIVEPAPIGHFMAVRTPSP